METPLQDIKIHSCFCHLFLKNNFKIQIFKNLKRIKKILIDKIKIKVKKSK